MPKARAPPFDDSIIIYFPPWDVITEDSYGLITKEELVDKDDFERLIGVVFKHVYHEDMEEYDAFLVARGPNKTLRGYFNKLTRFPNPVNPVKIKNNFVGKGGRYLPPLPKKPADYVQPPPRKSKVKPTQRRPRVRFALDDDEGEEEGKKQSQSVAETVASRTRSKSCIRTFDQHENTGQRRLTRSASSYPSLPDLARSTRATRSRSRSIARNELEIVAHSSRAASSTPSRSSRATSEGKEKARTTRSSTVARTNQKDEEKVDVNLRRSSRSSSDFPGQQGQRRSTRATSERKEVIKDTPSSRRSASKKNQKDEEEKEEEVHRRSRSRSRRARSSTVIFIEDNTSGDEEMDEEVRSIPTLRRAPSAGSMEQANEVDGDNDEMPSLSHKDDLIDDDGVEEEQNMIEQPSAVHTWDSTDVNVFYKEYFDLIEANVDKESPHDGFNRLSRANAIKLQQKSKKLLEKAKHIIKVIRGELDAANADIMDNLAPRQLAFSRTVKKHKVLLGLIRCLEETMMNKLEESKCEKLASEPERKDDNSVSSRAMKENMLRNSDSPSRSVRRASLSAPRIINPSSSSSKRVMPTKGPVEKCVPVAPIKLISDEDSSESDEEQSVSNRRSFDLDTPEPRILERSARRAMTPSTPSSSNTLMNNRKRNAVESPSMTPIKKRKSSN